MIFKPFVPYLNLKNKKAIQTLDYQSLYRFLVCPRRELLTAMYQRFKAYL